MNSWDLSIYRLPGVFAVRGGGGTAVFCLLPPHERDADTELLELVLPLNTHLFVNIPTIGVDRAHLFSELFRKHLSTDSVNHCIDHSPRFGPQLLIGRKEHMILFRVNFVLSFLRQALGVGLHLLHLPL